MALAELANTSRKVVGYSYIRSAERWMADMANSGINEMITRWPGLAVVLIRAAAMENPTYGSEIANLFIENEDLRESWENNQKQMSEL